MTINIIPFCFKYQGETEGARRATGVSPWYGLLKLHSVSENYSYMYLNSDAFFWL